MPEPARNPRDIQVEASKDPVAVGEVADDPAQRLRRHLDQGRGGDDLEGPGFGGMGIDVDHLEIEAAGQMLVADPADVGDRVLRARGRPGDEQAKHIVDCGVGLWPTHEAGGSRT
jgi:hypothetical protein